MSQDITLVRKAPVPPAIYLLAVVILGFATTLLRLPPIVDFLAAGFVLGVSRIPNLNLIGSLGDLGVAKPSPVMRLRIQHTPNPWSGAGDR